MGAVADGSRARLFVLGDILLDRYGHARRPAWIALSLFLDLPRVRGAASWTRGENDDLGQPLTRIPPLRGILSARRDWPTGWLEASVVPNW